MFGLAPVHENIYNPMDLFPSLYLRVPLRCACPTRNQSRNGVKYLVTRLVSCGDNISSISVQFSSKYGAYANGLSENSFLYPFTTILIPLPKEPSSSQTRTIKRAHTHNFYPSRHKLSYISLFIGVGVGVSLAVLCFILGEVLGRGRERKQKWNLPENVLESIVGGDQVIKVYEFEELVAATENVITRRRLSSCVYKGEVKTDISKEVKFHAKINHFNLISLTGVCNHHQLSYLVFEWNCRICIALDITDGLNYIHNFTAPAYVHKNICSGSILLNRDLRAKISNFSFARSAINEGNTSSLTKPVEGTNGYLAPEYLEAGQDESKIEEITDPRLQVKHPLGYIIQQTDLVLRLVKLCAACLTTRPESRPSAENNI
ncbi:unnamed protein product [Withania somnifera]